MDASYTKKPPLLVLTGPTAVGKTRLSIALAKKVGGEIISADSMQVYRHMDIGSAKIRPEEMQGVPHHMIDLLEPSDSFNIALFQQHAKRCIREILSRGHLPILVGGTGFYIQSVLYDIDFTKEAEASAYRSHLEQLASAQGSQTLHDMLKKIDQSSAAAIHPNNQKRIIRALEYYHLTGEPISHHNAVQRERENQYRSCYFVLTDNRTHIYEAIDRRVDTMLEEGLVEEVQKLQQMGCRREMVSMQGLGYKEILDYLNGEMTLEQAVYCIKRDTRHFAKRQLTWFRRERDVIWLDLNQLGHSNEELLPYMLRQMQEKGITWTHERASDTNACDAGAVTDTI